MDKYEYKVRADEINRLIAERDFAQAAEIADAIDWRRVITYFSDFVIFQVVKWMFLILHDFSDFVIFQVVKWMFLIFHDFQFSRHIPHPVTRL